MFDCSLFVPNTITRPAFPRAARPRPTLASRDAAPPSPLDAQSRRPIKDAWLLGDGDGRQRWRKANKSTVLAFASHDPRQPSNAAKPGLSALGAAPPHPDWEALPRRADRSLSNLEKLIRTLPDISKLDAGVTRPNLSDFRIDGALAPPREAFRPLAASRGLEFKICASKTGFVPIRCGFVVRRGT